MDSSGKRPIPKLKTQSDWKSKHSFLSFAGGSMKCVLCTKYKDNITSCKNFNPSFINGSDNFRLSTVTAHDASDMHKKSHQLEEMEKAKEAGEKYVKKMTPMGKTLIGESLKNAGKLNDLDRAYLEKLFHISYVIAKKGRPYTDFQDHIELEKLHGVNFSMTGSYENETACRNFINFSSKCIFDKTLKEKLLRVNFISVLCDGSTDAAVIEKECIYVMYVDPDTFRPTFAFLSLQDPPSQDASGIHQAVVTAFTENGLEDVLDKLVFLASDGASVNSGLQNGLISYLRETYPWVVFVWCVSHRLELSLKHALSEDFEAIDTCLRNLFYMYEKSSKKTREVKALHAVLKEMLEFENNVVKPHRAAGTRWISHKLLALNNMLDKYGLYMTHLENIIADTSKKTDKATLEGKRRQMEDANIILSGAVFHDLLEPARELSLFTQKEDTALHEVTDVLNATRNRYVRLAKKFAKHPDAVYELPKVKKILSQIVDGNYQGMRLKNFERGKNSLMAKAPKIVQNIVKTMGQYFEKFRDVDDDSILTDNVNEDGNDDKVLFHIANVVNSNSWATEQSPYENAVSSFNFIFNHYADHPVINGLTTACVEDEFIELINYAKRYHNVNEVSPLDLWQVLRSATKGSGRFNNVFMVIELCLCAPYANAIVERFFNYMKIVKTDWRSKLNAKNLESLLRIRVEGPDLGVFSKEYCSFAVDMWWSEKQRRLNQGKRKKYSERKGKAKQTKFTNEFIDEFLASSSSSEDEE